MERTAWLLIDRNPVLPYSEQYVLFDEFEDCVDEAVERGLDTGWMGRSKPQKGFIHSQKGGPEDLDISYIEVTIQGKKND